MAGVTRHFCGSDHRLLRCNLATARRLARIVRVPPKPRVDRLLLQKIPERDAYIDAVDAKISAHEGKLTFEDLDAILVERAEAMLAGQGRRLPSWFLPAEEAIKAAQEERNEAMLQWAALPPGSAENSSARRKLQATRKRVKLEVKKARTAWLEQALLRIETVKVGGEMLDQRDAWRAMKEVAAGMGESHPPRTVPVVGANGPATNDKEQVEIMAAHFEKLFNRPSTYDKSVLDRLTQRPVLDAIGTTPDLHEVVTFLRRASNEKAAGLSGAVAEYYKAISHDEEVAQIVTDLVGEFWESGEMAPSWIVGRLKEIGKAGKDLSKCGNYRGVCLLEVAAKAVSAIAAARLQILAKAHGRESQSGFTVGRGCPDSSFALKCVLHQVRAQGQEAWLVFIDLVKAFDSVDREAMCDILLKYGAPPSLVRVVRSMHRETRMKMFAGEEEIAFESKIGVLQGAAASPVIFLFVVAAWFETMDWPSEPVFIRSNDGEDQPPSSGDGIDAVLHDFVTGQASGSTDGLLARIRDFLYADDAALLWLSRQAAKEGMTAVVAHGKRWGLEVHVAPTANDPSKTEFLVIPPPILHPNHRAHYDRSPIKIGDAWITHAFVKLRGTIFPGVFKYLGSYITEDLREDFDVDERIAGASRAFGRFKKVIFKNGALSIEAKARAFTAFVLSILFYQSECWALRKDLRHKISVFFNRCIRSMTGITRLKQRFARTTTAELAAHAGLRTCDSYLDERCLRWAGHVARMASTRLPRLAMFGWFNGEDNGFDIVADHRKRIRGATLMSFGRRLRTLLLKMPKSIEYEMHERMIQEGWVALAQDRRAWADVVRQFCDIPKVPTPKDERLMEHIAGRPYAVYFRKKDEEQQGGANAAAAGHAAGAPAFESEFDRLVRIGN